LNLSAKIANYGKIQKSKNPRIYGLAFLSPPLVFSFSIMGKIFSHNRYVLKKQGEG